MGSRYRAEATPADPPDVDVMQPAAASNGPAFHAATLRVHGQSVTITRRGASISSVARAATAPTAKRAAIDGLHTMMRRLADERVRLAVDRDDRAREAYESNDASIGAAYAATGTSNLGDALAQRTAEREQLIRQQQAATRRDPNRAREIAALIAVKQQDIFDLRSLLTRVAAATRLRDQATTERSESQASIDHWRTVARSAAAIPVKVRSSVSGRHLFLRLGSSVAVLVAVAATAVALARGSRVRSRRTRRSGAAPDQTEQESRTTRPPCDPRFIDLIAPADDAAAETPSASGAVDPVQAGSSRANTTTLSR
jgi:hypothetical protein